MDFIESIGPLLGMAAFLGLAILAFLLFQQARDVRRLREWAGRAPERAREAAEAVQAAAEASRGETPAAERSSAGEPAPAGGIRGRLRSARERISATIGARLAALDRRLPIDGRYVLVAAVIAAVAAGVLTSGFGLFDDNAPGNHEARRGSARKPTVAVLNGTSVPGLAARVGQQVVKAAGYRTGAITNAGSSFSETVVMFASGHQAQAKALATAVKPELGGTPTQAMTAEVRARAGRAPLALGLGLDDSRFQGGIE
jgi:LytR cell envelope-related transcriptional attenuator